VGDGEAQARPLGVVGRVEGLEDALEVAAPDPASEVRHRQPRAAVAAGGRQDDVGAGRGVAEGVVDEDAHDLGDALRIAQGLYPPAGQS
jgi:hypothetical protein